MLLERPTLWKMKMPSALLPRLWSKTKKKERREIWRNNARRVDQWEREIERKRAHLSGGMKKEDWRDGAVLHRAIHPWWYFVYTLVYPSSPWLIFDEEIPSVRYSRIVMLANCAKFSRHSRQCHRIIVITNCLGKLLIKKLNEKMRIFELDTTIQSAREPFTNVTFPMIFRTSATKGTLR